MTFDEYQQEMVRTYTGTGGLIGHVLGLAGETGEVADLIKKDQYHSVPYNWRTIADELGDVLWYLTAVAEDHGLNLSDIAQINVDKLRKRYPDGFVKGGGIRS